MQIFISIVSHGHGSLIKKLACVDKLCNEFNVVVKSNISGDCFEDLVKSHNNFFWLDAEYGCGFAKNNNIIFDYCKNYLGMHEDDVFIVLNPDVIVDPNEVWKLINKMQEGNVKFACVNLFRDYDFKVYDNSIRQFPTIKHFIKSFFLNKNNSIIDKSLFHHSSLVDWAAGSFLAFQAGHYNALSGFDESYFMYCEDIDICYRSRAKGIMLTYYPDVKAIHLARHNNRRIFSKHFFWHVRSVIRFLISKNNISFK